MFAFFMPVPAGSVRGGRDGSSHLDTCVYVCVCVLCGGSHMILCFVIFGEACMYVRCTHT